MGEQQPDGRIVLFGATGYTGRLTAQELVRRGARPVLAGRNHQRLRALSDELGCDLECAGADIADPASVRALLRPGDLMLSTVGPFTHWGGPAIEAAIEAGSVAYLDSTGEPGFIRRVFEHYGPAASAAGVPLMTAMGYDWVPGNLAAALAVREAAGEASTVEVAYFLTGGGGGYSGGTMASTLASMTEPGFGFEGGAIRRRRNAQHLRTYELRGRSRPAVSIASSEHFALPPQFPELRDVEVFLGWFGSNSRPLQIGSAAIDLFARVPGARAGIGALVGRAAKPSSGGPDEAARAGSGSYVMARARDRSGEALAEVHLQGVNGYTFTAAFLAWAAIEALSGGVDGDGALGPTAAYGIDRLEVGVESAGMVRCATPPG